MFLEMAIKAAATRGTRHIHDFIVCPLPSNKCILPASHQARYPSPANATVSINPRQNINTWSSWS
jgi:hypothetical protein